MIGATYMLGHRLKEKRKEKSLTQKDVADKLGIGRTTYAMYESENRDPDTDTLQRMADFFEVTTDYLLGRDAPGWASEDDVVALDEFLDKHANMSYGGENLTEEEKQRVKDVITGLFWEKAQKRKEGGVNDRTN